MNFCYCDPMALMGHDEPNEMFLSGNVAIEFMTKMGEPLVDYKGRPIDPNRGYYITKDSGGLVPFGESID